MKMPLVEALSALATLLSTYQVVRGPKPAGESATSTDLTAPGLMLAYEFAKSAGEDATARLNSIRSRLAVIATASGLAVVAASAVVSFGDEPVKLDSALFLTALGLAAATALLAVFVLAIGVSLPSPRDVYEKHLAAPDAAMLEEMLSYSRVAYDRIEAVAAIGRTALLGLSVLFAVEVILLAAWIPVAH
jgi:hypothetical protein